MSELRLENEREYKIYNAGAKEGAKHSYPSPETLIFNKQMTEKINLIEISQAESKKDISYIKEAVARLESVNNEQNKKMDDFINCADKKYSPIWVAEYFRWLILFVFGAILTSLLSLIIK